MLGQSLTTTTSTYSTISVRPTSTFRGDAARPLDNPRTLTVSHDVAKSGRVSTVIYIDDNQMVSSASTLPKTSNIRGQLKFSYNPVEGRTDIATDIAEIFAELKEILTPSNLTKILNKEH